MCNPCDLQAGHEKQQGHGTGLHQHEHVHGGVVHRHAHYHPPDENEVAKKGHGHAHTYSFEVYSFADSPIHRLDARVKTIALIVLILAIVAMPVADIWRFVLFALLVAGLYVVSGVPLSFGLKRSLVVVPFVLFTGSLLVFMPDKPHPAFYNLGFLSIPIAHGGIYILVNALVKSLLSVLTVILLYSTTPFPSLIKGLESLKAPRIITMLLSFLYRFMWVLTDEVKRMLRARDARAFGGGHIWHIKVAGQMIGSLFIRSYERSERIYAAMASRGYDGTIKSFEEPVLTIQDGAFSVLFLLLLLTILLWRF
jgi:cobalt/nickel transport system permease protein